MSARGPIRDVAGRRGSLALVRRGVCRGTRRAGSGRVPRGADPRPGRRSVPGAASLLAASLLVLVSGAGGSAGTARQTVPPVDPLHAPLDEILDAYVRDGLVYYRALQGDRARLDRYIASLDVPAATYESWPRERQAALWLNAYNAIVLRTVVDHYPIRGRSADYPPNSIRQIPGAFDRTTWRVAGGSVTLDAIEQRILPGFRDPRMYLALGRGAVGGGRLRSEAFTASRLEEQLAAVEAECPRRASCALLDRTAATLTVSPIFSWRSEEFVTAYAARAGAAFAARSPIERAIIGFVLPHLTPAERDELAREGVRIAFGAFDWRPNDLTGGRPR